LKRRTNPLLGRNLSFEPLESRLLLTATMGVQYEFTDAAGTHPLTSLCKGHEYLLNAYVQDLQSNSAVGISQAYLAVDDAADLVSIPAGGSITHGTDYSAATLKGDLGTSVLVEDAGGGKTDDTAPAVGSADARAQYLLFSVPIRADAAGSLSLTTSLPTLDNTLFFGSTTALTMDDIQVSGNTIPINDFPSVSSTFPSDSGSPGAATVDFTVIFDTEVSGVDITDFVPTATGGVTGVSVTSVTPATGPASSYTVTVNTGSGDGMLRLDLNDNDSIVDGATPLGGAGVDNGDYVGQQYHIIDKAVPTVAGVTSTAADGVYGIGDNVIIAVAFSEAVTVTGTPQLQLETGATDRNALYQSGSGTNTLTFQYTVEASDTASDLDYTGTTALTGTIKDATNNAAILTLATPGQPGSLGAAKALVIDGVSPMPISIVGLETSPTGAGQLHFTVTFSEAVTGVDATDFVVNVASGLSGASVASVTKESDTTYAVLVGTGSGTADGTLQLKLVDDNSISDAAGNPLGGAAIGDGSGSGLPYTVSKPPTASLSTASANPTNAASVSYQVTFTETVSGVDQADFSLSTSGISGGEITAVTGDGSSYVVVVSTGTGDGTLQLLLNDNNSILDGVGNALGGTAAGDGNVSGGIYTIDRTAATVTSVTSTMADGSYKQGDTIAVTVAFSEAVTVTGTPQLQLETGATDRNAAYLSGSGTSTLTFQYTVAAGDTASDLDYTGVSALSGTIKDAAGNDAVLTLAAPGAAGSLGASKSLAVDGVVPTATLTMASTNPVGGTTASYLVTFTEDVSGVDVDDFTLTASSGLSGTSITSVTANTASSYTVLVNTGTGTGDGTLQLDLVDNDTILDAASNPLGGTGTGNGSVSGPAYTIAKPPTVAVSRVDSTTTSAASVHFLVTFSEAVTGFDSSDLTLATSGISGASISQVEGSGASYTVTVATGTGDGTLALTVLDDDTIMDGSGYALDGGATSAAYSIEKSPTVTVAIGDANPTSASSVSFMVTFSESVTGVDTTDFSLTPLGVTGTSITSVQGSGASYVVTVNTGSGDGTLGLNVLDDDTIVDGDGNPLAAAVTGPTYTIDRAPTVAGITTADDTPTGKASVRFAVTFSESVTGVDASDFQLVAPDLAGAVITGVTGSGSSYTVTVSTGTGSGALQLNLIDDNSIEDMNGNALGGSGTGTIPGAAYTIDKVMPGVTSITKVDADPTNASSGSVSFTVLFSEAVTGVDTGDFVVPGSSVSGASVASVTGSGTTYTVRVNVSSEGTLKLNLADNDTIHDLANNPLGGEGDNADYTDGESYTIDKTAPLVSSIVTADTNPSTAESVRFTVTFSEYVSAVDTADFALVTSSGLSGCSITSVTGSGATYTVTVSTGTGTGTLELDLADDGTIKDLAGNQLGGSGADNGDYSGPSYSVDRTTPAVSSIAIAGTSPTSGTSVTFTVTFSETVTGVDKSDFALATSAVSGASITSVSGSGTTYTVTVGTGTGSGSVQLNLTDDDTIVDSAGVALGGSGTGNGDFIGSSYIIDKTAPAVSSITVADANPTSASSVRWTVTFSEAVTDVDSSDFTLIVSGLTSTSITSVTGSGTTWTVTASTGTGTSNATMQLKLVDNDSIKDTAGNVLGGTSSGTFLGDIYTVEKGFPTVSSITTADTNPTSATSVRFTVTFSESVTGVDTADFSLATSGTSGTISSVSGSGTTYTVTVTGISGTGTLGLNLTDNDTILDTDSHPLGGTGTGNGSFTGSTYTITASSDTTAPSVSSITTADTNPSSATSVRFTVTFSESVTGVDAADFTLATSGTAGTISSVSGSGTTYTVTVSGISGAGTLGLNLTDNDTIVDAGNNALSGSFTGATYTIKEATAGTASIAGYVYVDSDNDGSYTLTGGGHHAGLGGVTVRLRRTDVSTEPEQVRITKSDGSFSFTGLAAGTYTLIEDQPSKFTDGIDTVGTGPTTVGTVGSDSITGIVLAAGGAGTGYNFGERGLMAKYYSATLGLASAATNTQSINQYSDNLVVGAAATVGLYDATASAFYLRNTNTMGAADTVAAFGEPGAGWLPISGDWDNDGMATIGLYDPKASTFYLRSSNTSGLATTTFGFGTPGGNLQPIVGDWNKDGIDTVGLYDPATSTFYLRNSLTTGMADVTIAFGTPGGNLQPLAGDWNGDGRDTVGLYNPASGLFALTNTNVSGMAAISFTLSAVPSGGVARAGDWNGDGTDTVGVYHASTSQFALSKGLTAKAESLVVAYGPAGDDWLPVAGQWTEAGGWESLLAADGVATAADATTVGSAQLNGIVEEAIARWQAAGLPQDAIDTMKAASVEVADLAGANLGLARGNRILIDADAAGHGWFVDSTPGSDEEFAAGRSGTREAVSPLAVDQIDLETVVMHELGHVAGLDDLLGADSLMGESLKSGVRKTVGAEEVAAVFALDGVL
jgi:hypothetical protein